MTIKSPFNLVGLWPKVRGMLAYGAGPLLGLASGPLLARAMGADGRGQFAAIMQPLTLAGAVASIGIPAAATYFVAKSEFQNRSILLRGIVLSMAFAASAYGCLWIYSKALGASQGIAPAFLRLIWLLIFVSAVIQIMRGYLQGQARWRLLDMERFVFAVLRFSGVAILALVGVTAAEHYAVAALAAFVVAGALLWLPNRRGGGPLSTPDNGTSGQKVIPYRILTGYSLSAALGTIAVVANNRLDQVLLPLLTSNTEVGFYAVAVTVAEVPIILGTLAARDALFESSRGKSPTEVFKTTRLYLIASTILGTVLALLAPFYMGPVFGSSFEGAVVSVQILCLGTIVACFGLTITAVIAGMGRPARSSVIPLTGLVATCALFWVFESDMNATRAAVIASVSQIASAIVGISMLRFCKKQ